MAIRFDGSESRVIRGETRVVVDVLIAEGSSDRNLLPHHLDARSVLSTVLVQIVLVQIVLVVLGFLHSSPFCHLHPQLVVPLGLYALGSSSESLDLAFIMPDLFVDVGQFLVGLAFSHDSSWSPSVLDWARSACVG